MAVPVSLRDVLLTFESDLRPRLPRLIRDESIDLLVARTGGNAAGYGLAHRLPTLFAGGAVLGIMELCVDEGDRHEGIGSALVLAVMNRAWALGCVEATVPMRRARGFYQSLGFRTSADFLKLRRPGS